VRLNQLLAALKQRKSTAYGQVTALHRNSQKIPLLSGIERTYQPRDDDGDHLPGESQRVQINLQDLLHEIAKIQRPALSDQLAVDKTNQHASADVVIDGQVLLADVPAVSLLSLEKLLNDWATILEKLPLLDPSQEWEQDPNSPAGIYRTPPVKTVKTKKVPRNHVIAEATDKHPAQVQVYHEDIPVGDWTTIRYSGAMSPSLHADLRERLAALQAAVKHAREQANMAEVTEVSSAPLLSYLVGG